MRNNRSNITTHYLQRIWPSILLLFISINVFSQFLNKDAVWITGLRCATDISCEWFHYYDYIEKDTSIQDINYSIFNNWGGRFALREADGKIYYKGIRGNSIQIDTVERIMYDFTLSIKDTFELSYRYKDVVRWEVEGIDSIVIGSNYKKKINLREVDAQYNRKTSIVEDIGSLYGLFWLSFVTIPYKYDSRLSCYIVNDVPLYGECSTVGLKDIKTKNEPIIFYDQNISRVKINWPTANNCMLNIYSLSGIKILSKRILGNQYLDLCHFRSGFYIIEAYTKDARHCEKVLIN